MALPLSPPPAAGCCSDLCLALSEAELPTITAVISGIILCDTTCPPDGFAFYSGSVNGTYTLSRDGYLLWDYSYSGLVTQTEYGLAGCNGASTESDLPGDIGVSCTSPGFQILVNAYFAGVYFYYKSLTGPINGQVLNNQNDGHACLTLGPAGTVLGTGGTVTLSW